MSSVVGSPLFFPHKHLMETSLNVLPQLSKLKLTEQGKDGGEHWWVYLELSDRLLTR